MYRLALALLILAATPAAASAAPFGELPPLTVASPARCLRATGAPGEVVRWAPGGADFVQATASGFGAPVHVALGDGFGDCPLAMAQPSGAAIVVEQTYDGIAFAVREPAGAWGPAQTIAEADGHSLDDPVAAVSAHGDAVVAWTDTTLLRSDSAARLLVARRPAGGAFGKPIELQPLHTYRLAAPHIAVGMQDDGTVTALWNADGAKDSLPEQLFAAAAAPGALLGPAQRLSEPRPSRVLGHRRAGRPRARDRRRRGAHARAGAPARRNVRQGGRPRLHREPARGLAGGGAAAKTGPRSSRGWTYRTSRRMRSAVTDQDRSAGRSASARGRCTPTRRSSRTSTAAPPPRTTGAVRGPRSPPTAEAGVHVGARPNARRADLDRCDRRDVPGRRPGAERPTARRGLRHAGDPRGRPARDRVVGRLHRRRLPPTPRDRGRSSRAGALGAGGRDRPRRPDTRTASRSRSTARPRATCVPRFRTASAAGTRCRRPARAA